MSRLSGAYIRMYCPTSRRIVFIWRVSGLTARVHHPYVTGSPRLVCYILSGFMAHCVLVYRLHGALSSSGACALPGCTALCCHEACVVIRHVAMPSLYRVCSYTRMPVLSSVLSVPRTAPPCGRSRLQKKTKVHKEGGKRDSCFEGRSIFSWAFLDQ